ncbi:hypothetical protein OPV22_000394 [Ensete ventricosum]|uniref:GH16 domain-containing protein n=1 Tax=Ensete ventricosum TaxID=4639 RepID=A0AAV8QAL5_ENSVE|nr:hypothetical protein OPV22_000394 [Ensete ventricosum]
MARNGGCRPTIIFSIDGTPIREVGRCDAMSGDYASEPMSIYATIWDASDWATSGGRYKVDYDRAPFEEEFSDIALLRCRLDPIQQVPGAAANYKLRDGCDDAGEAAGDARVPPALHELLVMLRQVAVSGLQGGGV